MSWGAIVALGGILSAATAPGQTAGLSVFTDPIIADWDLTRTTISVSYLIGTLIGAAVLPLIGRAMDRWNLRALTVGIGVGLAGFLFALSLAEGALGLTVGFTGIRMMGQGALSLAATTLVARMITHRRGLALGLATAAGSGGISLAPLLLAGSVHDLGIRATWQLEALAVLCIVLPAAALIPRRHRPDPREPVTPRDSNERDGTAALGADWTLTQAMRTGMFWILVLGLVAAGMLSTALAFHQISVLGGQGLDPVEAAANFLPQTLSGIAATLAAGSLVDRIPPKYGVVFAMATLAAALLLIPGIEPGWSAIVYGLVLGAAGGGLRGVEAAAFAHYFGTRHIGTIRGVATAVGLAATALGPLLLSLGRDLSGDYTTPALILAALPLAVGVAALLVRSPRPTHATARTIQ
ncbi:MFS transporter [Citricoccus sp. NPDC079358]|uniref:MFS transporter n=1 Tax=Citricoccus sp. NPDC079358 TaxID=3154653 RepID=UPI00344F89A1